MYLTSEAILAVALTIERKAIEFYARVRHRLDDELVTQLILEEREHIRRFREIFDSQGGLLARQTFENPYLDDATLAATFADGEVFGALDPEQVRPGEVLEQAIAIERNAILFYNQLLDAVGAECAAARALLHEMVKEEQRHLQLLSEREAP